MTTTVYENFHGIHGHRADKGFILGSDGTNPQIISTDNTGAIHVIPRSSLNSDKVWDAAATGIGSQSDTHTLGGPCLAIYGNVSGNCVLTLWVSDDNVTYYESGDQAILNSGDFSTHFDHRGVRYLRLVSDTNVTATVICSSR